MAGSEAKSQELWQRYWRVVRRIDPSVRSPEDQFCDRIIQRVTSGRWLDAGCGRKTMPEWRERELRQTLNGDVELFGCDLDHLALKERLDPGHVCTGGLDRLPFRSGSFSFVSSNMVFEHLEAPECAISELARVTRPGGRILISTVNAHHYLAWFARATPHVFHEWIVGRIEGREAKDVYPVQYKANTARGLERMFSRCGCRRVAGGAISSIPFCVPFRGLFWLGIYVGFMERWLSQLPGLRDLLRPNLLLEFEKIGNGTATDTG